MHPIHCKRPSALEPKSIGEALGFNFYGPSCMLAAISGHGLLYVAHDTLIETIQTAVKKG
jgi:hypothetical protein